MLERNKNLQKEQRLFLKMSPYELQKYCERNSLYSLPAAVRDYRTKEALDIMEDCTKEMEQGECANLAAYIKGTFTTGNIVLSTQRLVELYKPVLENPEFETEQLRKAILDFTVFAQAPIGSTKRKWIAEFVGHLTSKQQEATDFQKGMEARRQKTCLFSHTK